MKKVTFLLLATVSFASAEEAKKLTIGECLEVYAGLNGLDGFERILKDNDRAVKTQYKLGDARMTIALNMGALKSIVEAFNKTRQDIILEIGEGKPIVAPDDKAPLEERMLYQVRMNKVSSMIDDVLKKECSVTPGRLKLSDLKIGDGPEQNALPPSVISAILPITDK